MTGSFISPNFVGKHFESLEDPRDTRNRKHLLVDIIVIAICGVIVGGEGPTAIIRWAKAKEDWLRQWLPLPHGIPSRDCLRRVLTALKPEAFQACFQAWIADVLLDHSDDSPRTIAIDGKTMRRSHDRAKQLGPLHLVSAWASEHGLALGQIATEEKSNEITAIPELIDHLDLQGAVVTIDAMGCQKPIAKKIVDGGGDYVLAVKDNQPKLHQAIQQFFTDELEGDLKADRHDRYETHDQGHGRMDDRYYWLAKLPDDFVFRKQWAGLKAVGMASRITTHNDGSVSTDTRYFIVSGELDGKRFADSVRGHWGIENSLHWVLDVTFNEDQSRTRERRMADNLSWLRRFAISLLKHHPSKDSLKGKKQTAGWNDDFLLQVLGIQET